MTQSSQKQVITVIGNVASGKSTLVPVLAEALDATPVYADDLFQTTDPFAKDFLQDIPRWALANELWLTKERAKMLAEQKNNDKLLVIDSGLLMSWIYTHSHLLVKKLTLEEWELYEELYDVLCQSLVRDMTVVRLKFPMQTLMKRLMKRGRDYELEFYTEEYLEQLEAGIEALERKLQQAGVEVVTLTEEDIGEMPVSASTIETIVAKLQT